MAAEEPDLEALTVKDLRRELLKRGLDCTGCLEKADLVSRLRTSGRSPASSTTVEGRPPSSPGCEYPDADQLLRTLSVHELKSLLKIHDVAKAVVGATERRELEAALKRCVGDCPICLDTALPQEGDFRRCGECRAPFHRPCVAQHCLTAAEAGRLPLQCPVPGCRQQWSDDYPRWAMDQASLQRFQTAVKGVEELRKQAPQGSSSSSSSNSPRTEEALRHLGIVQCPGCGAGIQKQASGLGHGCDKMTCRCGCRFCFVCRRPALPTGASACTCVPDYHSYLPHQSVLHNYDDDPLGPGGVPFLIGQAANQFLHGGLGNFAGPLRGAFQPGAFHPNLYTEGMGQPGRASQAGRGFAQGSGMAGLGAAFAQAASAAAAGQPGAFNQVAGPAEAFGHFVQQAAQHFSHNWNAGSPAHGR